MRKVLCLLMFVIAATCSHAQDAGKIILVKVYESVYPNNCKPSIRIFKPDNTIESIDLEAKKNKVGSSEQDENDKKVREQLDKIVTEGYTLKTSNQSNDNEIVNVTTYVFEKK